MLAMNKNTLYITVFLFVSFLSNAQNKFNLSIVFIDDSSNNYSNTSPDSISLIKELNTVFFNLESEGYISAKVISQNWKQNNLYVKALKGEVFEFNEITFNETLSSFYEGISLNPTINPADINKQFNKVLTYCENNGYPFATIFFSDITLQENKVNAKANLVLNDYFLIDSIAIKGNTKTNRFVVYREIGIYPGERYNESEINKIRARLTNSDFLSYIRYSEISFTKGKALLTVFVNDKTNNKFGGIVGINSDDKTGRIILSGDVDLKLTNGLKVGDKFVLNWRKTRQNTQNFFVSSSFPYLFKSRFGVNGELTNLRRDTTFSNTGAKVGVSYQIQTNQFISIFAKNNRSNSLFESINNQVPSFNSTQTVYYGMEFDFNTFDYSLNPRRGSSFKGTIGSGVKTIYKSSSILNEDYKSLKDKSAQYELVFVGEKFFPLFKSSAFLVKGQIGQLFNDNIFENELYQLGGLKSLRGFNEQSITASNFIIGTVEYRFLFDKNSALFTFLDYGYYEQRINNFSYDSPYGFGIGVNLAVNSGIFTLSYALGTEQNNPILFRNSKVHFGFVSVF